MQNNQFLLNAHLPSPKTLHFTRPNNVCLFVQDKVAVKLQVGVYTIPPFLMLSVTPGPGLVGSRFNVASLSNQACFRYHLRPCFVVSSIQSSGPRMLTVPACQLHLAPLVCLVFKQPELSTQLGVSFGHTSFVFIVLRFQHGVPVGPKHRPELSPEGEGVTKLSQRSSQVFDVTASYSHGLSPSSSVLCTERQESQNLSTRLRP